MRSSLKNGRLLLAGFLIVVCGILSAAEFKAILVVKGDVPKPGAYSLEQLQKLPVTKIKVHDQDGSEPEYAGVTLHDLLHDAGASVGEHLRGAALSKAVIVHAADGYQALLSFAEVDSTLSEHPVLLAWSRNDEPLVAPQGPLRLIVSGDKRPARWVRQVTAIEVVPVSRPAITNVAVSSPASTSNPARKP